SNVGAPSWRSHHLKPGTQPGLRARRSQRSCPYRMHALPDQEVQSKMSHCDVLAAGASRHNDLAGGSSPPGPTTQSPKSPVPENLRQKPANAGLNWHENIWVASPANGTS